MNLVTENISDGIMFYRQNDMRKLLFYSYNTKKIKLYGEDESVIEYSLEDATEMIDMLNDIELKNVSISNKKFIEYETFVNEKCQEIIDKLKTILEVDDD